MTDKPPAPSAGVPKAPLVGIPKTATTRLKSIKAPPTLEGTRGPMFAPVIPKTEQKLKPNPALLQKPAPTHKSAPPARGGYGRGGHRGGRGGLYGPSGMQFKPKPLGPSAAAAPTATAATRRERKPKTFDPNDIAPTAVQMRIDPFNPTHPITLPFMDPHVVAKRAAESKRAAPPPSVEEEQKEHVDVNLGVEEGSATTTTTTTATATTTTKDASSTTTVRKTTVDLFRNEDGEIIGEDQIFFMQLPAVLPIQGSVQAAKEREASAAQQMNVPSSGPATVKSTTDAAAAISGDGDVLGFKSTLTGVPSGQIGKILLFKSGKAKLQIGDVLFDISSGMPTTFLQEVVAIAPDSKKFFQLSDIPTRVVCYPDVASLLCS